jgi:hypothetical protein
MVVAFVNGEQRGVAQATEIPFGPYAGQYSFLMLIYSNEASGETVDLKFYDNETDVVYDLTPQYEFVTDMTLGTVVAPEFLTIGEISSESYSSCDGDDCDDVDEDGICDDEDDCVGLYDECGICNGDGIADGTCDCDGNTEDCDGVCGGSSVEDECGICGGDGSSCGDDGGAISGGCDLPANNIHLSGGDVWYNADFDIGGFQWNVDGATVTATSGGDAAAPSTFH